MDVAFLDGLTLLDGWRVLLALAVLVTFARKPLALSAMPRKAPHLDAARLGQMENDLQAAKSEFASLGKPLQNAQRRVKRKVAQPLPWRRANSLLRTVLVLYYWGPFSPRLPLPYLRFTGKEQDWLETDDEEITALIERMRENAFLNAPD